MQLTDDDRSLEDIVYQGEPIQDKEAKSCRINVNSCPELVVAALADLRKKHENLSSLASVCRYTSKAGLLGVQGINAIKLIEKGMKAAYLTGSELDRLKFSGHSYSFGHRLSCTSRPITAYLFEWVQSAISDTANTLGLKTTTLTIMALVVGLAKSERWVPPIHHKKFIEEAVYFWNWLNERAKG
jgi:hypothetical protein